VVARVVAEIPDTNEQQTRQRAALHDLFTGPKLGFDGSYAGHYTASCKVDVMTARDFTLVRDAEQGSREPQLPDVRMVLIMAPVNDVKKPGCNPVFLRLQFGDWMNYQLIRGAFSHAPNAQ
jgi:hypothetical protein